MKNKQTCILVLGMHRSGTSAIGGVLDTLGVNMGEELLPPAEDNPKGFFENKSIKNFNDEKLFLELNSSWDDLSLLPNGWEDNPKLTKLYKEAKGIIEEEYSDSTIFGIKDPRMSILFPFWKKIFNELNIDIKIIISYRNPFEIATSLMNRNNFTQENALALWAKYNICALVYSDQYERCFISYDELIVDVKCNIEKIKNVFNITFPKKYANVKNDLASFLDKNLNHCNKNVISGEGIIPLIINIDEILKEFMVSDEHSILQTKINSLKNEYELYVNYFNNSKQLLRSVKFLENRNEELSRKLLVAMETIAQKNALIEQRDETIFNKNALIQKRDEVIENKNIIIKKNDNYIFQLESKNAKYVKNMKNLDEEINQLKNQHTALQINMKEAKQLLFVKEQEIRKLKELAQSMRLINRFRRALYIDNASPIIKTLKSVKNDGIQSTYVKIKNKFATPQYQTEQKYLQNNSEMKKNNMLEIKKTVEKNYIPKLEVEPFVSLLILTKDGLVHIKRLFKAIAENTLYKNFEIIVVDNASDDETVSYLKENEFKFNLKIIENAKNESFSYANNQAAKIAKGEYLLLLNNDIEPLKGWLTHLVYVMITQKNVGSVGSQLIYPYADNEPMSTKVQHSGIAFKSDYIEELNLEFFRPYNLGMGKTPIIKNTQFAVSKRVAVTAACLLVRKDIYFLVDGLDEDYNYGYEDVDFGLKLHKAGYINYYSQNSILFHYESSTQKLESQKNIKGRRIDNINLLHFKWHDYIKEHFFFEKFKNKIGVFAEKGLKIAFAVTEAGPNAVAGDYFTALELANSFKTMGYDTTFLCRRGGDWYNVPKDVDIVVSMLDAYDLTQVKDKSNNFISVAWIRNWPDRWLENNSFTDYNLIFASSQKFCDLITEKSGKDAILFPIATTPEKFIRDQHKDTAFESDYTFTGNYWGKPREIETYLEPSELDFKFNVYGKDWHLVEKFKKFHKGFLKYEDIPKVYANSKITIDDAVVGITKPYGSVNSRVFDAIAGGTLVISNGIVGAKETFGELLPTYETKEELHSLLNEYLTNHQKREEKIKQLQDFIFNYHTYRIRAQLMKQKIEEFVGIKKSIAIKMPIPRWSEAKNWGDYHLALGLQKQFEQKGYHCLLQILSEWDNEVGNACDIVLVLRGLSKYNVKKHQINLMWNISHPDKISIEEYNEYDTVFVSSEVWANHLQNILQTKVEIMHQCTDPDVFKPVNDMNYKHQLLFVGNSRNIFRKSLKYLLPTKYELAVFGTLWEKFIDKKYIKAQHIENQEVHKYYANADIVLNDHWDSMQENGFVSNRLFDVLACNGFILTDKVEGIHQLFGDAIITYDSKEDLAQKITFFLENKEKREEIAQKGRELVLKKHTYKNRVDTILKSIKE